jgi:hypothetical protein
MCLLTFPKYSSSKMPNVATSKLDLALYFNHVHKIKSITERKPNGVGFRPWIYSAAIWYARERIETKHRYKFGNIFAKLLHSSSDK